MNLPKQVVTDGNIQCGHCRLFEIARLPYINEQQNLMINNTFPELHWPYFDPPNTVEDV